MSPPTNTSHPFIPAGTLSRTSFATGLSIALVLFVGEHRRLAAADRPELPKDAEVHVIGVYQPAVTGFDLNEVIDWPTLATSLHDAVKQKSGGPAQRVWDGLPEDVRLILSDADRVKDLANRAPGPTTQIAKRKRFDRDAVANGFSKLLNDDQLHAAKEFADLELSDKAKELIRKGKERSALDTRLLNRMLLRTAFPGDIRKEPADPSAVVVDVTSDKPVILVLTGHVSCRWEVRPGPEAKVVWVILSGYHHQAVEGIQSPVTLVGRKLPSGNYADSISAYEKTSPRSPPFEKRVKELTGRGITSVQRASTYSGKPFTVPPSE